MIVIENMMIEAIHFVSHENQNSFNVDEIVFAAIEHDDKAGCSRPKAVFVDLQLILHGVCA